MYIYIISEAKFMLIKYSKLLDNDIKFQQNSELMTYSGVIIKKKKKKKEGKLRKVFLWRDFSGLCYKIYLAIWNFKAASRSILLVKKKNLTKKGPLLFGWTCSSSFSKIWMRFWDKQETGENLTLVHPVYPLMINTKNKNF